MGTIYSSNLCSLQGLNGHWTSPAVPAGELVIIRDVDAYYGGGSGCTLSLIGIAGQTIWIASWGVLTSGDSKQWDGRQVIGPGQTFALISTDAVDVTVSGYTLIGP